MKKTITWMLCLIVVCVELCSCGQKKEPEKVSLTVWCSKENKQILGQMADEFRKKNSSEADIDIHIGIEAEDKLKASLLSDLDSGADVFAFPDDQFYELASKNALLPVSMDEKKVIEDNGGKDAPAIQCATYDGKLSAYPMTATNGYFMFYDSRYFTEEDVTNMDRMLDVAEEYHKKVCMDWSSGWYIYSFFAGAGFNLKFDPVNMTNECDWNKKSGKYKGTDVAKAMLHISKSDAFVSVDSDRFKEGVKNGDFIAGVSGTWNVDCVSKAYGQYYSATKLPTFTIDGDQVQMASFSGYKLVGVNSTTNYPEWAQKFALWITNEDNQELRFEKTGEGPSNRKVAASKQVQQSQAVAALTKQSQYSTFQSVGENYWNAATVFGTVMASRNKDGLDLQKLLDELVKDTEEPPKKK